MSKIDFTKPVRTKWGKEVVNILYTTSTDGGCFAFGIGEGFREPYIWREDGSCFVGPGGYYDLENVPESVVHSFSYYLNEKGQECIAELCYVKVTVTTDITNQTVQVNQEWFQQ